MSWMQTVMVMVMGVCLLATAACDDDEGGTLTPEEATTQVAEIQCGWFFGCCPNGTADFQDEASCVTSMQEEFEIIGMADSPNADYNASAAAECISAVRTRVAATACDGDIEEAFEIAVCETVVVGKLNEGDTCAQDFECAGNLECGQDKVCHSLAGNGESCADIWCEDGLSCNNDVCVPLAKAGEDCSSLWCDDELYCDMGTQTCMEQKADGDACDSSQECLSYECDNDVCVARPVSNMCE